MHKTKTWSKVPWTNPTLREKCPNAKFFLVRIFLYSDWIQENSDQKNLRIWTHFTQCKLSQNYPDSAKSHRKLSRLKNCVTVKNAKAKQLLYWITKKFLIFQFSKYLQGKISIRYPRFTFYVLVFLSRLILKNARVFFNTNVFCNLIFRWQKWHLRFIPNLLFFNCECQEWAVCFFEVSNIEAKNLKFYLIPQT